LNCSSTVAQSRVRVAVARRLVARHGGTICGESDGASGATFRFTLPADA
jgi:signal transduction histidine kinase